MRIKGIIAYNGKDFFGYQIQKNIEQRSVQKEIQDVLSKILNEDVKIYSSGRTDRGVHALNQVIHFDMNKKMSIERLKHALNSLLPDDIFVKSLEEVDDEFHSRFSAKRKEYKYIINLGEYDPINKDLVYNLNHSLDEKLINSSLPLFIGEHSFINFCSNNDGDYVRTIYDFRMVKEGSLLIFYIQGNGFRRYMVRMIIGTLIALGEGKITLEEIDSLINSSLEKRVSFKAPAEGLYLNIVEY